MYWLRTVLVYYVLLVVLFWIVLVVLQCWVRTAQPLLSSSVCLQILISESKQRQVNVNTSDLSNNHLSTSAQVEVAQGNMDNYCHSTPFGRVACVFRWLPIVEQAIEGPHAAVQREIVKARRHSGQYVSLALRGPELDSLLSSRGPAMFNEMADLLDKLVSPLDCLQALGLNLSFDQKATHKHASQLIYHLDAGTQFRAMKEAKVVIKQATDKDKKLRKSMKPPPPSALLSEVAAHCLCVSLCVCVYVCV
jgi:hypothetical protein